MADTTIMRWVHRFAPELERRCNRFARPLGHSSRVEKTDVKIRERWITQGILVAAALLGVSEFLCVRR